MLKKFYFKLGLIRNKLLNHFNCQVNSLKKSPLLQNNALTLFLALPLLRGVSYFALMFCFLGVFSFLFFFCVQDFLFQLFCF